jgi:hypothetical protein
MEREKLLKQLNELTVIMVEKTAKISKLLGLKKDANRWLTGADVKSILKISESTLRRMRNRNEIPYRKMGKSYYYPSAFFEKTPPVRTKDTL